MSSVITFDFRKRGGGVGGERHARTESPWLLAGSHGGTSAGKKVAASGYTQAISDQFQDMCKKPFLKGDRHRMCDDSLPPPCDVLKIFEKIPR